MLEINVLTLASEEQQRALFSLLESMPCRWLFEAGLYPDVGVQLSHTLLRRQSKHRELQYRLEVMPEEAFVGGAFGQVYDSLKTLIIDEAGQVVYPSSKKHPRIIKKVAIAHYDAIEHEYAMGCIATHLAIKQPSYEDHFAYTVMAKMPGRELFEFLDDLSITIEQRFAITIAILEQYQQQVANHGLVHRDLKPENIMLELPSTVNFIDYQFASPLGTKQQRKAGTLSYTAPEVFTGDQVSIHSEVHMLGRIIGILWHARMVSDYKKIYPFREYQHAKSPSLYSLGHKVCGMTKETRNQLERVLVAMLAFEPLLRIGVSDALSQIKAIAASHVTSTSPYALPALRHMEIDLNHGLDESSLVMLASFLAAQPDTVCYWKRGKSYHLHREGDIQHFYLSHDLVCYQDKKRGMCYQVLKSPVATKFPQYIPVIGYFYFKHGKLRYHKHQRQFMVEAKFASQAWEYQRELNDYRFFRKARHLANKKPSREYCIVFSTYRVLPGTALQELIQQGDGLTVEVRLAISQALLKALQEQVHGRGYVHRNLSIDMINVVIQGDDVKVYIDNFDGAKRKHHSDRPLLNKWQWASPEVFTSTAISERSDVFSMARIIAWLWNANKARCFATDFDANADWLEQLSLDGIFAGLSVDDEMAGAIKECLAKMLESNPRARLSLADAVQAFEDIKCSRNTLRV